jgi:hypothetical protein
MADYRNLDPMPDEQQGKSIATSPFFSLLKVFKISFNGACTKTDKNSLSIHESEREDQVCRLKSWMWISLWQ